MAHLIPNVDELSRVVDKSSQRTMMAITSHSICHVGNHCSLSPPPPYPNASIIPFCVCNRLSNIVSFSRLSTGFINNHVNSAQLVEQSPFRISLHMMLASRNL